MQAKNKFFLLISYCQSLKIRSHEEVTKQLKSRHLLIFGLMLAGSGQINTFTDPGGLKITVPTDLDPGR
jgi:hypothetical protein